MAIWALSGGSARVGRGSGLRGGVMARPCKMSVPLALRLAVALHAGLPVPEAARAAGLGRTTLYRWLAAGRRGDPRFRDLADAVALLRRPLWDFW
jgi:hypothetical protein